jgi:NAD(P) transhydrogenase subunit alpha
VAAHDVVITTALIPGRPAPRLIEREGVEAMKPGSVIVDLAAANGGNCAVTEPDARVLHAGVQVFGPTNLPAGMPFHASQMYARTVTALILDYLTDDGFRLDLDDDILKEAVVTHGGAIVNERVKGKVASVQPGGTAG